MIGILDWELCTLGSPLADLGNLLLPFSVRPIQHGTPEGDGLDTILMVGLKDASSDETGLPQREDLEKWWVEGMRAEASWHGQRAGEVTTWNWPIPGMG